MRQTLLGVLVLLLGMALLMLGNGSLPTVLAVRLAASGETARLIGLVMAQSYVGIVLGTLYGHKLKFTVGHIHAFAVFGSTMSAVTLAHVFIGDPWAWAVFRFLVGACAVGMLMCVESWLNARTDNEGRGHVFSLYVITVYLLQGISQFLIQLPDTTGFAIYAVLSVLLSLSIVPVAVTRVPAPVLPEESRFDFVKLWRTSPTGMVVSLISGVIQGAFCGLGPAFAQFSDFNRTVTALFMSVVILGGLLLQWPVGKFSDGRDRRRFMFAVNILLAAVCTVIAVTGVAGLGLIGLAIVFGGLSSALYPLAVAYTNDYLEPENLVPAASGLVMAYGIGAIAGPLVAKLSIEFFGAVDLFLCCGIVATGVAGLIFWRMRRLKRFHWKIKAISWPGRALRPWPVSSTHAATSTARSDPRGQIKGSGLNVCCHREYI